MIPISYVRAEYNKPDLIKIVHDLTKNCNTPEEKTKAILAWFDRNGGNMHNIWGITSYGMFYFFKGKPFNCMICQRINNLQPSLFVLTSRIGACGEHAALFRDMAKTGGISVRCVVCPEIDHVWDEVLINNTWIVVDPSNVASSENRSGYDMPTNGFEPGHAGRTRNITYIYAEYPDGSKKDITGRYTRLATINVITVDERGTPVVAHVSITSYNKYSGGADTQSSFTTDSNGRAVLKIGGGDIKLISDTKEIIPLYNETRSNFTDGESYQVTLILKSDWTKSETILASLVVLTLVCFVLISYMLYIRIIRSKKKEGK
jgi:hypothetical protein